MDRSNSVAGVITIAIGIGIYVIGDTYGSKGLMGGADSLGPSFFPKMAGTASAVLGLLLLGNSLIGKRQDGEQTKKDQEPSTERFFERFGKVILTTFLAVGYIFLFNQLGY